MDGQQTICIVMNEGGVVTTSILNDRSNKWSPHPAGYPQPTLSKRFSSAETKKIIAIKYIPPDGMYSRREPPRKRDLDAGPWSGFDPNKAAQVASATQFQGALAHLADASYAARSLQPHSGAGLREHSNYSTRQPPMINPSSSSSSHTTSRTLREDAKPPRDGDERLQRGETRQSPEAGARASRETMSGPARSRAPARWRASETTRPERRGSAVSERAIRYRVKAGRSGGARARVSMG